MRPRKQVVWRVFFVVVLTIVLAVPYLTRVSVVGQILDASSGKPVAGALVVVARLASTLESASMRRAQIVEIRSDTQGHFEVRFAGGWKALAASNRLVLMALATGYVPKTQEEDVDATGPRRIRINAPVSSAIANEQLAYMARRVAELYADIQPKCMVTEVPQLLAQLASAGQFDLNRTTGAIGGKGRPCEN